MSTPTIANAMMLDESDFFNSDFFNSLHDIDSSYYLNNEPVAKQPRVKQSSAKQQRSVSSLLSSR